jgi:hypothetical protein
MLAEKKTLFGLSVLWFTGCSAVSPGHFPFCARASISVPGAPASSLATGSQVLVLNPEVEICAPVCVATALLCTSQPREPRFETSLAPVPDGELVLTAAAIVGVLAVAGEAVRTRPLPAAFVSGMACALVVRASSAAAEMTTVARRAGCERVRDLMAGNSCPAPSP